VGVQHAIDRGEATGIAFFFLRPSEFPTTQTLWSGCWLRHIQAMISPAPIPTDTSAEIEFAYHLGDNAVLVAKRDMTVEHSARG